MESEDEAALLACLDTYKKQLDQVEQTLSIDGSDLADLHQLRDDLVQLIQLTEESVISLKKSRLLSLLESTSKSVIEDDRDRKSSSPMLDSAGPDMDEEFKRYQSSILGDEEKNIEIQRVVEIDSDSASNSEDIEEEDLSGMRCRAPYSHDWGEMSYHNAIVLCEEEEDLSDNKVRVMFCNPTHCSMRPCPYFMEGKCRFTDTQCRFSHGYSVSVADLKPFMEPDHSKIVIGCQCLAKDDDEVWYKATVVEVTDDEKVKVEYNANGCLASVKLQDIFPMETDGDLTIISSQNDDNRIIINSDDELDSDDDCSIIPTYLLCPSVQMTDAMGQWEEHTKGIGSKLMARMGYIVGQGLGKNSDGRAEPVPIQLLPQGKSLDKIMELKEKAGSRDLFHILKQQKKKQKNIDNEASKNYKKPTNSLFDFINRKLYKKKGKVMPDVGRHHKAKSTQKTTVISTQELSKRSDTHLNVQLIKTEEEIKNAQLEIKRLKEGMNRNLQNKDEVTAKKIQDKILSLQEYEQQLRTSEKFIHQQKKSRKAQKELTKF